MKVEVGRLRRPDRGDASRLLARAFAEDPILTHFLSDALRRRLALPAFFCTVLEELIPYGQVYTAHVDEDLVGVAAWQPPHAPEPEADARHAAERQRRVVRMMFPSTAQPLFEGFAALEQHHPKRPHWYLAFIGIDPTMQGRSIGRGLLAPVLRVADQTSTLCYLETPFARTREFYRRLGFVRDSELTPFAGAAHPIVTFVREPRSVLTVRL